MILASSMEFEKGHNSEVQERPSDNFELPEVNIVISFIAEYTFYQNQDKHNFLF